MAARPLAYDEAGAAKALSVPLDQFRALVRDGHLPDGREIAPGWKRWEADMLAKIVRGEAAEGGMEW